MCVGRYLLLGKLWNKHFHKIIPNKCVAGATTNDWDYMYIILYIINMTVSNFRPKCHVHKMKNSHIEIYKYTLTNLLDVFDLLKQKKSPIRKFRKIIKQRRSDKEHGSVIRLTFGYYFYDAMHH